MTKAERTAFVLRELEHLFPDPPIPLNHSDPFSLLVAVLLSAQCTDERVNQVTPDLFALAKTPAEMANLEEEDILAIVRPCGLGPQKAKAIRNLSRILVETHAGEVPCDLEELESLPGVGHKTAQVVMAQAFGEPSFPVDTHIHRLAQRWGLSNGKSVQQTEKDLKRLFPRETWNRLHLQIIYYGRTYCMARRKCDGSENGCPFCPVLNAGRKLPRKTRKA
ncbi:endonuclease III [Puniceicoccales bacterium CK1056]|uniref:Endonuclease III n=1 Tax=Oceanipulchritudo coccoides TaxID=2706888 RepID=A0A6B2M131_9BACT|nr:endonuclease III [Oceanipulchritudo coccoides]